MRQETLTGRENARRRYAELSALMAAATGHAVPDTCRTSEYVWERAMLARRMRAEGFSLHQIGAAMGKDHSTVVNAIKKLDGVDEFPRMYWDILPTWEKFKKLVDNETDGTAIQDARGL